MAIELNCCGAGRVEPMRLLAAGVQVGPLRRESLGGREVACQAVFRYCLRIPVV